MSLSPTVREHIERHIARRKEHILVKLAPEFATMASLQRKYGDFPGIAYSTYLYAAACRELTAQ